MTEAAPLLRVRGLTKFYPVRDGLRSARLRALHRVDLTVARGEAVALVGESGSGKSTTARMIARLESPDGGTVELDGVDVLTAEPRRASLAYRKRVQMIFQDPFGSLNPVHDVAHHIERPLQRHMGVRDKAKLHERVIELLETVGLTPAEEFAAKFPHECSGGQRQRVAIARALAVQPDLILADEPTSMLDVSLRIGVLNLMGSMKRDSGIGFLFITHDLAAARYFADRIMVMYAGSVVEVLPAKRLHEARHPYTKLLLSAVPDPRADLLEPVEGGSGGARLTDPPPGCGFAERCPRCEDDCRREFPTLDGVPGSDVHRVRCPVVLA